MNWFGGVISFEEEELCDYRCGEGVVDFAVEADDAFLQAGLVWVGCGGSVLLYLVTFINREKISSAVRHVG